MSERIKQDRGSDQAGMRAYNERLVLSLVRRAGGLAKVDIARSTGLSAQTVSVIMRGLEQDGLLVRGLPVKGRVGQPSVPMHLAADGAFSIGLKIGRRSADLALMDFSGVIREQHHEVYSYPTPAAVLGFAADGIAALLESLPAQRRQRVAGIGIATPFELWSWAEEMGAPRDKMARWQGFDLAAALGERFDLPVCSQNDATAACGAELVLGRGADLQDFVYFFIGSFIGGGVVLNNAVFAGRTGNAGALGSMPVPGAGGETHQLIEEASIFVLENRLRAAGRDPRTLWQATGGWAGFANLLDPWVERTAQSLAHAIVACCSVIDFPAAIIDGGFPVEVRAAVVAATQKAVRHLDLQGIRAPRVLEGAIGANARVIGGACLPFFERFLVDQNVLFKAPA